MNFTNYIPSDNTPMIPLPNPGEGGPVYDPDTDSDNSNTPVIPLPNPGEGGPVYSPGPSVIPDSIISVWPKPVIPCFFCSSNSNGSIRFLNCAVGYQPFIVSVNSKVAVDDLEYAEISEYGKVASGYQTVTVSGDNGYIYISKQIHVTSGTKLTVAITNTSSGLDFTVVTDFVCNTLTNASCFRVCNLSYTNSSIGVLNEKGQTLYTDIGFMQVTPYDKISPGTCQFHITSKGEVLVATEITIKANSQYTMYVFNWENKKDAIRVMVVEDRK